MQYPDDYLPIIDLPLHQLSHNNPQALTFLSPLKLIQTFELNQITFDVFRISLLSLNLKSFNLQNISIFLDKLLLIINPEWLTENEWETLIQHLFQSFGKTENFFLLAHKHIWLFLQYLNHPELVFTPDYTGKTVFHRLCLMSHNLPEAQAAIHSGFIALQKGIESGILPRHLYDYIFFTGDNLGNILKRRLLSKTFINSNVNIAKIVLFHANKACASSWLSFEQYKRFLLEHPGKAAGHSYLHECLLLENYKFVYMYISACLQAILENKIYSDDFKEILLFKNNKGFLPIYQAINNRSLEIAELFLNLFKFAYPEDYPDILKTRTTRQLRCSNDKPFAKEINAMVTRERYLMKTDQTEDRTVFYYPLHRKDVLEELESIMKLIRAVGAINAHGSRLPRYNKAPSNSSTMLTSELGIFKSSLVTAALQISVDYSPTSNI